MRDVIFDNWSLEEAKLGLKKGTSLNKSFVCLIEAIILWENISYFSNGTSSGISFFADNDSSINYSTNVAFGLASFGLKLEDKYVSELAYIPAHEYATNVYKSKYAEKYTEVVANGALFYLLLSQMIDSNYFPCDKRAEFMANEDINDLMFSYRDKVFKDIDQQAQDFIKEIKRVNRSKITFQYPLLLDHVILNSKTLSTNDLIRTAYSIKSNSGVAAYRNWMNNIETSILNGDISPLYKAEATILEVAHECFRDFRDDKLHGELTLAMAPPFLSLSVPFKKRQRRQLHLSFIRKMARQSLSRRSIVATNVPPKDSRLF